MAKILLQSIVYGAFLGLAGWFVGQLGLTLHNANIDVLGAVSFPIFHLLADWPRAILSLILPEERVGASSQGLSMAGWLLLGILLSFGFHLLLIRQARNQVPGQQHDGDQSCP